MRLAGNEPNRLKWLIASVCECTQGRGFLIPLETAWPL
jgi:hypothetical protein